MITVTIMIAYYTRCSKWFIASTGIDYSAPFCYLLESMIVVLHSKYYLWLNVYTVIPY